MPNIGSIPDPRLVDLEDLRALRYRSFTFPTHANLLSQTERPEVVAIGLERAGRPIGLGLGMRGNSEAYSGDILSLAVAAEYRTQGYGSALLNRLECRLQQKGACFASLQYMSHQKSTPYLERMLRSAGWEEPVHRQLFCASTYTRILKAPWMRFRTLPDGFETFSWPAGLQDSEWKRLTGEGGRASWFPELLNPLHSVEDIDGENSLGLRFRGDLVGWLIAFRIAPTTVRYQKLFIKDEFQKQGLAIRLLAMGIYPLPSTGVDSAVWDVIPTSKNMLNFVERGLRPYCTEYKWSMGAIKRFS